MLKSFPMNGFVPTADAAKARAFRDVVAELAERGVKFLRLDVEWIEQDDLGIWESPDGKVAWFIVIARLQRLKVQR